MKYRPGSDYIDRTIATVRVHRDADNCWPSWANTFADEIEALRAELAIAEAQRDGLRCLDCRTPERCGLDVTPRCHAEKLLTEARLARLRADVRHVIADSPGTPSSVKGFLRGALADEPERLTCYWCRAAADPDDPSVGWYRDGHYWCPDHQPIWSRP